MTTATGAATIVEELTINAPAARIFAALTDPNQRREWWGATGRIQTTQIESDLRVGGKWKMSGTGFGKPFSVSGEYRAIEFPRLLAFTWLPSWEEDATETLVRFDLSEKDGVTTVRVTHSGLTPKGAEAHKGWAQILAWLRTYAERP